MRAQMLYEQEWELQQQRKAAAYAAKEAAGKKAAKAAEESAALLAEAEAAEILHKRKEEEALVNKFQVGDRVRALLGTPDLTYGPCRVTKGNFYTVQAVLTTYSGKVNLNIRNDNGAPQTVLASEFEFIERPKKKEEASDVNKWTEGTQVVWKGTANSHCASWLTTGKRYTVRRYDPRTKYLTITTDRTHHTQVVDPSEVSVVPMVEPLEKEEPAVVAHRFKIGDRFTWPGKSNMARASIIKDHTYTVETLMDTGHGPGVKFRTHADGRLNYIHECDIEKANSHGASSIVHNAKEVSKNMSEKLNTFWNNNYNIIIWIILALLADNYFFKGAFQDKVKELISGALDHTKKAISADEA